jgi:hypothetical protein
LNRALQRLVQRSYLAPGRSRAQIVAKIREVLQPYCQEPDLELPELVESREKPGHLMAEADRCRHLGFPRHEGFAGGPGSLA